MVHSSIMGVKDNNVYVRDGFLLTYQQQFEDGCTYKASLSEVFTYSTREQKESIFSDTEILSAQKLFNEFIYDGESEDSFGGKLPNSNHFFKAKGSNRMLRSFYFTIAARRSAILPMKIMFYCTALECLFSIGTSEINHKIAERVAIMLGDSEESKKHLFKLIKEAYNCRSTILHGQHLKGADDKLIGISKELDDILRKLVVENHEVFSKNDNDMEEYFLDLLFRQSS